MRSWLGAAFRREQSVTTTTANTTATTATTLATCYTFRELASSLHSVWRAPSEEPARLLSGALSLSPYSRLRARSGCRLRRRTLAHTHAHFHSRSLARSTGVGSGVFAQTRCRLLFSPSSSLFLCNTTRDFCLMSERMRDGRIRAPSLSSLARVPLCSESPAARCKQLQQFSLSPASSWTSTRLGLSRSSSRLSNGVMATSRRESSLSCSCCSLAFGIDQRATRGSRGRQPRRGASFATETLGESC